MTASLLRLRSPLQARQGDRVTLFEVFFDLVFVFALTRVVELMASDPEPGSLVRGLLVLFLLWWAWCAFIWLGNQVRLDRGFVLAIMLTVMAALFVVALFLPSAWLHPPGGAVPASVTLAVATAIVAATAILVGGGTSRSAPVTTLTRTTP